MYTSICITDCTFCEVNEWSYRSAVLEGNGDKL